MSEDMATLQAIVERFCSDCVALTRTHNPMLGWVWLLDSCCFEKTIEAESLAELERILAEPRYDADMHQ